MKKGFREIIFDLYGINPETLFIDPISCKSSAGFRLNDKHRDVNYTSIIYDRDVENNRIYVFTQSFVDYKERNDVFFFVETTDSSEIRNDVIGQILQLDPNTKVHKQFMSYQYVEMIDFKGKRIKVYFEDAFIDMDETEYLLFQDLYWMKDYHGVAKDDQLKNIMVTQDLYGEPLNIGDVIIDNNLSIAILDRLNFDQAKFLRISEGFSHSFPVTRYMIPVDGTVSDKVKLVDGKFVCKISVIKAPEHIVSKVLEWKLSQ